MKHALAAIALLFAASCAKSAAPPGNRVVEYDAGAVPANCATSGSRSLGDPCACTGDCAGAMVCATEEAGGLPHGICVEMCQDASDCPGQATCFMSTCFRTCSSEADCAPHNRCFSGICTPFCLSNDDCESGNCNVESGRCLPAGTVATGGGPDDVCTQGTDCRSGQCVQGHCYDLCSVDAGECANGAVCFGGPTVLGDVGVCLQRCNTSTGCPTTDRHCATLFGYPTFCLPQTTDGGCLGSAGSPTASGPCGCSLDCDPGETCAPESVFPNVPHGSCAHTCASVNDCPGSEMCIGNGSINQCVPTCAHDSDCAGARICFQGVCSAHCQSDADCFNGTCNLFNGLCQPTPDAGLGVAEPCTNSAQCKSGVCDDTGVVVPTGFCETLCSSDVRSCPDSAVCVPLSSDGSVPGGICAMVCTSNADCPAQFHTCTPTPGDARKHCQ